MRKAPKITKETIEKASIEFVKEFSRHLLIKFENAIEGKS
jgi:hypothetical protein